MRFASKRCCFWHHQVNAGVQSVLAARLAKVMASGIWFAWPEMSNAWPYCVQKLDSGKNCCGIYSEPPVFLSKFKVGNSEMLCPTGCQSA